MKYGIKVPIDNAYLWVTKGDSFNLEPFLFEDKKEAEEHALTLWGKNAIVEIYPEEQNGR